MAPRSELSPGPPYRRPIAAEVGITLLLVLLTVGLTYMIFPPRNWWPAAFFCLTPWVIALQRVERAWVVHWLSFLGGWLFFLVGLAWLFPVTDLGYVALAFYLAIYWPLAGWGVRTARRFNIGATWSLPVVWVATEWLRGTVMSGFPWLLLAHSQSQQIWLIQASDLIGAYGVTFILALVNGALAEALLWLRPPPWGQRKPRRAAGSLITAAIVLTGALTYGWYRVSETQTTDGPRVAVVQEDFPLSNIPPYGAPRQVVFADYVARAAQAAAQQPDLLVFPETVWGSFQNIDFLEVEYRAVDGLPSDAYLFGKLVHNAVSAFARGDYAPVNEILNQWQRRLEQIAERDPALDEWLPLPQLPDARGTPVPTIVGAMSVEVFPENSYPKMKRYNSALVYDRDGVQRRARYDKQHLVPFGEVVPFRTVKWFGVDMHWLYRWLNKLSPFSGADGTFEYSLWPGEAFTVFTLDRPNAPAARFAIPICYEDVMPYIPRHFVYSPADGKRVDFLVNISNDGWFLHSDELPQHLAICVFRAVENRVPIARAVNTGISGFIDSCGRTYGLVNDRGRLYGPGVTGYSVQPVKLDPRVSFYSRSGDWLAVVCTILAALLWLSGIATRWILATVRHVRGWLQRRSPSEIAG